MKLLRKNYRGTKKAWKLDSLSCYWKISVASFFLFLISISAVGCFRNTPDNTSASGTSVPAQTNQQAGALEMSDQAPTSDSSLLGLLEEQKAYSTLLDLNFDDLHDLDYFSFNTESLGDQIADEAILSMNVQDLLHDGALNIEFLNEQQKYSGMLSQSLSVGEGLYWQYMLDKQTCFSVRLDGRTIVGFEGESYGSPRFFVQGAGSAFFQDFQGTIILHPDQWMGQFFWLEERQVFGQPKIVFNNIFWDPNNPDAYLISHVVLPDFDVDHDVLYIESCDDSPAGNLSLDTLQIINGDFYAFLKDKSESYQKYPERLYTFFTTFPFLDGEDAQ